MKKIYFVLFFLMKMKFRVAAFITCIGPDALDIHNRLAFENEIDKQNFDKLLDLWHAYYLGETNVIYERSKPKTG